MFRCSERVGVAQGWCVNKVSICCSDEAILVGEGPDGSGIVAASFCSACGALLAPEVRHAALLYHRHCFFFWQLRVSNLRGAEYQGAFSRPLKPGCTSAAAAAGKQRKHVADVCIDPAGRTLSNSYAIFAF